jgi:hypothetical protein
MNDDYDLDAFDADREKAAELMFKMEPCLEGYSRMVIVLACARTIAAMHGPARAATREQFLQRFPGYMRSMWKLMDAQFGR